MNAIDDRIVSREKKRKEVFVKLQENFTLPSPSATVMEVIRLCTSERTSLAEIAKHIESDPALSAEIIQYANSAFLATGVQVASVQKATVKLGMKTVVNLALGFSLLAANRAGSCDGFDYPLFWRTSLAEAVAARELAKRNTGFDADELFICALLAHMGSLALATIFPQDYSDLLATAPPNNPQGSEEMEKFGIDSGELTMELFLSWGLPAHYALAAGFHEDLDQIELGGGQTHRTARLLFLAHTIATMCQCKTPRPDLFQSVIDTAQKHSIEINRFSKTFAAIVESWQDYGRLFALSTEKCHLYDDDQ